VVNDALGSIAVLVAAAVIAFTGFLRADALASLLIGVLILPRTWKLLRETVEVLMDKTPKGLVSCNGVQITRFAGHWMLGFGHGAITSRASRAALADQCT
jgi:Co/Zn/Cd efflux system component